MMQNGELKDVTAKTDSKSKKNLKALCLLNLLYSGKPSHVWDWWSKLGINWKWA